MKLLQEKAPVYRLRKINPNRTMRNFTRDCAGWRVQVMHKKVYYAKTFSDSNYNDDFVQSLIAARIWHFKLLQKLSLVDRKRILPSIQLTGAVEEYQREMLKNV